MNLFISLAILLAVCSTLNANPQTLADTVEVPVVRVQVYYSPYSQKALDFMKMNLEANKDKGIWALMVPKKNDDGTPGDVTYKVEVDFYPWGRANRTTTDAGVVSYICDDKDCTATRLHACIARNHVPLKLNHHEFFMIVCTSNHASFKTEPLQTASPCVAAYPDVPDDGASLSLCASHNDVTLGGNGYLSEMMAVTDALHPVNVILDNDPIVFINGERNDDAITDLRTHVCRAISGDRPAECDGVGGGAGTVYMHTLLLALTMVIGVVYNLAHI